MGCENVYVRSVSRCYLYLLIECIDRGENVFCFVE